MKFKIKNLITGQWRSQKGGGGWISTPPFEKNWPKPKNYQKNLHPPTKFLATPLIDRDVG